MLTSFLLFFSFSFYLFSFTFQKNLKILGGVWTPWTLSGSGYLMSLMVRGGTYAPLLISKSTNSILMTLYPTLYKNCSHYRSAICFKIGLGLAEIIRCLCTKVVFLQIIGDCVVAWTSLIEFVACMFSENCCE